MAAAGPSDSTDGKYSYPSVAASVVVLFVLGCSMYANFANFVIDREHYRFFPPFLPKYNRNFTRRLGGEYYNIAKAINAGRGYSDPFFEPTGPTSWMPPVFVAVLAGLHWACQGDVELISDCVVTLQNIVLIITGLVVIGLVRQHGGYVRMATAIYFVALLYYFLYSFQFTHDCWIVLFMLESVIAGLVWARPLKSNLRAVMWGGLGGFCALTNPIVGFVWIVLSILLYVRQSALKMLVFAFITTGFVVSPWVVRNYYVFGRFIPIKSNLFYELYQAQVLESSGALGGSIGGKHPYGNSAEHQEYKRLGEMAYLDHKRMQFWQSLRAHPCEYAARVLQRFLVATVKYVPGDDKMDARRQWTDWLWILLRPIPFLSLLILLASNWFKPLTFTQRIVVGVYVLYLVPYLLIGYYERYAYPLIVVQVPIIVWAVERMVYCCLRPGRNYEHLS